MNLGTRLARLEAQPAPSLRCPRCGDCPIRFATQHVDGSVTTDAGSPPAAGCPACGRPVKVSFLVVPV